MSEEETEFETDDETCEEDDINYLEPTDLENTVNDPEILRRDSLRRMSNRCHISRTSTKAHSGRRKRKTRKRKTKKNKVVNAEILIHFPKITKIILILTHLPQTLYSHVSGLGYRLHLVDDLHLCMSKERASLLLWIDCH